MLESFVTCYTKTLEFAEAIGLAPRPTALPLLSLPYTHYSLLARCQALRRRFVEHRSREKATPTLKDPDRVPDPSTLHGGAIFGFQSVIQCILRHHELIVLLDNTDSPKLLDIALEIRRALAENH